MQISQVRPHNIQTIQKNQDTIIFERYTRVRTIFGLKMSHQSGKRKSGCMCVPTCFMEYRCISSIAWMVWMNAYEVFDSVRIWPSQHWPLGQVAVIYIHNVLMAGVVNGGWFTTLKTFSRLESGKCGYSKSCMSEPWKGWMIVGYSQPIQEWIYIYALYHKFYMNE